MDFILIEVEIIGGILRRRFGGEVIDEEILIEVGEMKFNVDAIKNWATEMFGVIVDLSGSTSTGFDMGAIIAARTGIHGGKKRKVGRKSGAFLGARN